jgi:serine/threonine protein phosphatase PrpC
MAPPEAQTRPGILVAVRSDRGKVRAVNEDRVLCSSRLGVVVVADGIGGHRGGDVASELATRVVMDSLASSVGHPPKKRLLDAIAEAQHAIAEAAKRLPHLSGMGTTVVAALFQEGSMHLVHLGDSRGYRFRAGALERLTRDHSLVEELVGSGLFSSVEEAVEEGVQPSILTRGLGYEDGAGPEYAIITVKLGDLLLFCTDGLSGMVDDAELARVLADASSGLEAKADRLIEMAQDAGGLDNITLALVRVSGPAD